MAASTTRTGSVKLRWHRGPANTRRFNVRRNGRLVAVTKRLRMTDRARGRGRQHYRVIAVGRNGRVLASSPSLAVGTS